MTHDGDLKLSQGIPAEDPPEADNLDNAMLLAKITYEPYVYDVDEDITISLHQQRRYTMEDIGNMDRRLQDVEYYTSLSLLESDARNVKAYDDDGFDRLKNGFMVDDFTSHGTSATQSIDFKCSLDFTEGELRPQHYTTNVALEWNETASSNIQKAVANILTELKLDSATITTGLLHDTIEDTFATYETIKKEFGDEVADLVDGVTKISVLEMQNLIFGGFLGWKL